MNEDQRTVSAVRKLAQLDLARQMETTEFLREQIQFLRSAGYDALLLYLEDRIRTESYPYPRDGECYTADQIRELVSFASEHGMELIPCVASLGHAERFLAHPELQRYAEFQRGDASRFGEAPNVFCVSNPETLDFLKRYLCEVADLFPSRYFHVGLDEAFSFCYCPHCLAEAERLGGEGRLFLRHLRFLAEVLASRGKDIMMWSDMFEMYPDVISGIPKSVILIDWLYAGDVREYTGHFGNRKRYPYPRTWEQLGLRFIAAGGDRSISNMYSRMDCERQRHPFGFLVTSWEHGQEFMEYFRPVTAAVSFLMDGASLETAVASMARLLFDSSDPLFLSALRSVCSELPNESLSLYSAFCIPQDGHMEQELSGIAFLTDYFRSVRTRYEGNPVFKQLLFTLEGALCKNKIRALVSDSLRSGFTPERKAAFRTAAESYLSHRREKARLWDTYRPGLSNTIQTFLPDYETMMTSMERALESKSLLMIRFCLPNQFGRMETCLELLAGNTAFPVANGVFKHDGIPDAIYDAFFPVPDGAPENPDALRVTMRGYGGCGLCFAQLRTGEITLSPDAVLGKSGVVKHAERLLDNDDTFAWLGSQDADSAWTERTPAQEPHTVTLRLCREKNL